MPEDDIINNNTLTSSLYIHRRVVASVGNGDTHYYFNGYMGLDRILPDQNIRIAFKETHDKTSEQCSALMCMVHNNEIVVARAGRQQRAILVYKNHMGVYQRLVLADDSADKNENLFQNPQIIKKNLNAINLTDAFIISATSNFFGKENNYSTSFDTDILSYLNSQKESQYALNNIAEDLKHKAAARNTRINGYKKYGKTENDGMIVCVNRVIPGVITGITSQKNHAKILHESLMVQSAIVEMQTIVNSNQTWQQKMQAINEFRSTYIKLPWWKEHSYILTLIAIVALGMIFGGLFGGPLFLPALFLKTAHAAAAEGAIMGVGLTLTGASAHFACHYYRYKNKTPEQAKEEAISDEKRYPSPSLCALS